MAIIWIDIWDIQNGINAKKIINRHFNVGSIVTTIERANMNPGVPQCKNCWKWGHTVGVCHIQGSKCAKCNGPHLMEHHYYFTWCCKANVTIDTSWMQQGYGKRIMMTWSAAPHVAQLAPHVVGILSLLHPHVLWLVLLIYSRYLPHGLVIYIV